MYDFSCKNWYFEEVIIFKSYFIYTLFRGKAYFIGRKIILYLENLQSIHQSLHIGTNLFLKLKVWVVIVDD